MKAVAIHDFAAQTSSFGDAFEDMKQKLQDNGIFLSKLSSNMRNVKSIGACSRNIQTFNTRKGMCQMTQHLDAIEVVSNIDSNPPLYIPINSKNRRENLTKAMQLALERTKEKTRSTVVMYHPYNLQSQEIQKALVECGEEEKNILLHPQKSENESDQKLKEYLRKPNGFYVVPEYIFDGMESKCMIYLLHDKLDDSFRNMKSIRCNISRAVSTLAVIHEIKINDYDNFHHFLFHSMDIEPRFIECSKIIKYDAYRYEDKKCHPKPSNSTTGMETTTAASNGDYLSTSSNGNGNDTIICYPCIIYCHRDHKNRSHHKFGIPQTSSISGLLGMLFVDGARRIKCSIVGERKCCCGDVGQCELEKNN